MDKNRTIVYCRESRDDYRADYERIETQRDLLLRYCDENSLKVIDVVMDDDQTGTSFIRYNDIKERAMRKEFDIILFKNSARLGRNQKESLLFVDFLEEHGIKILFEDERYDEESFGLFAWFNERRARDDSKNIRRNLKEKIQQGKLIVKPIYGYELIDKQLKINENTAKVVKLIFELYVEKEWGYNKIAKYLNEKGYKTPSEERNRGKLPKTHIWSIQNIKRIIADIRYIGCYLGGTTEKISFKSKKIRKKPKEEWVVIPNVHEAIISDELWERAQNIVSDRRNDTNIRVVDKGDNIFTGLLYCGRCGTPMYKRKSKGRKDVYMCKKYWHEGAVKIDIKHGYGCTSHSIRTELLMDLVNSLVGQMLDNKEFKEYVLENVKCVSRDKATVCKEIRRLNEIEREHNNKLRVVYDDKLNNIIPEYLFVEKSKEFQKNIEEIHINIKRLSEELESLNKLSNKEELIFNAIESIKKNGLKREDLARLFRKITVFANGDIKESDKVEYGLTDKLYKEILENGGIAVCLNFMYQFGVSHRWVRDWGKTY